MPHEQPVTSAAGVAGLVRNWWWLLLLMLTPGMVGCIRQGIFYGNWGAGVTLLLISSGFGFILWRALLARTVESNWGTFHRSTSPRRYWTTLAIVALGWLGPVVVLCVGPVSRG